MWAVAANKGLTLSQVNKSGFTIVVVKVVVVGAVAVAAVLVVIAAVLVVIAAVLVVTTDSTNSTNPNQCQNKHSQLLPSRTTLITVPALHIFRTWFWSYHDLLF
jgi:hypothetical protein